MKYQIVKDEAILQNFVEWLPDLQDYQKFYICLFARKKYDKALQSTSSDKMQLKRDIVNKENIIQKLKQWEVEEGLYTLKSTAATQQSLAVYISPNPRDMKKAQGDLVQRLVSAMVKGNFFFNPKAEAISSCQKSKAYNYVVDFDIDSKDVDLLLMQDILPSSAYKILETKGGYHILVYPEKATEFLNKVESLRKDRKLHPRWTSGDLKNKFNQNWYNQIKQAYHPYVDQAGDQLIPIPGCTQGNFVPKFLL